MAMDEPKGGMRIEGGGIRWGKWESWEIRLAMGWDIDDNDDAIREEGRRADAARDEGEEIKISGRASEGDGDEELSGEVGE